MDDDDIEDIEDIFDVVLIFLSVSFNIFLFICWDIDDDVVVNDIDP